MAGAVLDASPDDLYAARTRQAAMETSPGGVPRDGTSQYRQRRVDYVRPHLQIDRQNTLLEYPLTVTAAVTESGRPTTACPTQ